jgi:hypothetical protein
MLPPGLARYWKRRVGGRCLNEPSLPHARQTDVLGLRNRQHELGAEGIGESVVHIDLGDELVVHRNRILAEVDSEGAEGVGFINGFKVSRAKANRPRTGGADGRHRHEQQGCTGDFLSEFHHGFLQGARRQGSWFAASGKRLNENRPERSASVGRHCASFGQKKSAGHGYPFSGRGARRRIAGGTELTRGALKVGASRRQGARRGATAVFCALS